MKIIIILIIKGEKEKKIIKIYFEAMQFFRQGKLKRGHKYLGKALGGLLCFEESP